MQRSLLVFAVALVALAAGVFVYKTRTPVAEAPPVSAPAPSTIGTVTGPVYPSFSLPDIEGNERNLSEWAGKHRLLNFWATWCAPCRREIPLLKAFQDDHRDGYVVIGIAVDFPDEVAAYADAAEFNYPILVGQEDAMAVAETSGVEFIGMPFTMIVGADGELLNTHTGEILREDLEHIVDVLTRLDAGQLDSESAREALNSL